MRSNKHLPEKQALGNWGEDLALQHMQRQGLKLIARNWRCKAGEIDLIMRQGPRSDGEIVFVEVRLRRKTSYGAGLETVAWQKQQKLIRAAQWYLGTTNQHHLPTRFDVISIEHESGHNPQLEHIEHAFAVG